MKLPVLGVLLALAAPVAAKGLTIEDMLAMQRVGSPAVSPDGRQVAFSVLETDYDANKGRYDIWLANTDGSNVRRMTTSPDADTEPHWSADGKWIYFSSTRSGSSQVWRIDPRGGEAEQVTKLPLDVGGYKLFPDGRILVALEVFPDAKTLGETVKRDDAKAKSKVKAQVYDQLLFRHWDQWEDGKYSHLFAWSPSRPEDAVDLTPGQATDSPTHPFGGMEETDISPDGKTVAFVARVSGRENAWKTNTDVFLVAADGKTKPVDLTADNKAYEFTPVFSPDGKSLALTRMMRPGFEADRQRIAIVDLASKKSRVVTEGWDRSAGELVWSADGRTIFTTADHIGNHAMFAVDVASGTVKPIIDKGSNNDPQRAGDRPCLVRAATRSCNPRSCSRSAPTAATSSSSRTSTTSA